jgi:hypothetical protein
MLLLLIQCHITTTELATCSTNTDTSVLIWRRYAPVLDKFARIPAAWEAVFGEGSLSSWGRGKGWRVRADARIAQRRAGAAAAAAQIVVFSAKQ